VVEPRTPSDLDRAVARRMERGKAIMTSNPGAAQLQALGKQYGIKNAQEILAKVKTAVANWHRYTEQADVSRKSTKEIAGKIKLQ